MAAASESQAGDVVPKSGSFSLRYTLVNPTTSIFGAVARGADAPSGAASAGDWIGWLMRNDGGTGFGHKMMGECAQMIRQSAKGYDLVAGNCIYTDADGDKLYESFDGLKGAWNGGTGKYAGISGALDLTDIVVTSQYGYEMESGVKVGSYTLK